MDDTVIQFFMVVISFWVGYYCGAKITTKTEEDDG
jgi:hypothetical protein